MPANLSESTWFFGQPNVSIQYRSATRTIYRPKAAGNPGMDPESRLDPRTAGEMGLDRAEDRPVPGRRYRVAPVLTHMPVVARDTKSGEGGI